MSSKSNQNFISSFAVLEEVLKTKANEKERCAAWRQQSLIVKYLEKKLDGDLMQRHWLNYCFPIEQIQESCKYINNALGSNEYHADIQFPSIENMNIPHVATTLNDMFSEVGIEQIQQPNGEISTVLETKINTKIENLCKPRNTMENFLQSHLESKHKQPLPFCSARELLAAQTLKQQKQISDVIISHQQGKKPINTMQMAEVGFNFAATKKSLGSLARLTNITRKNFVSPMRRTSITPDTDAKCPENNMNTEDALIMSHPALTNVDPKMVELINNEIIHKFKPVEWSEIAGLDYAKSIIKEAVVYPLLRPDIFTGIRRPPKGILLFGPPGTGKTLIGKCIASQSSSTFFSISSASLTSKWMGEGEKMVRALFAVAAARQPSVIFIDEIDSLLSQRSENENDGTRRLKTEFLVRLDGATTSDDDRVLIVGATNRPQELDEAVRRRFVKRLYVPLPDANARSEILTNLLKTVEHNLNISQIKEISELAEGYSGADIDSLCREASMEPLRSLATEDIITFDKENLRHVNVSDFYSALKRIRPSVAQSDLSQYVEWNKTYGSMF